MNHNLKSINFAVCIATYNGADYLREQLTSIVTQLCSNEIVFISDDGSTDDTVNIAESFGEKVCVVSSVRAGGVVENFHRVLTAAYNSGARNIILADQDDKWLDGRMVLIRERLGNIGVLMMNGFVADAKLNPTGGLIFEQQGARRGFLLNFLRPTYVGCCMAFKREILDYALPFPANLPWHDWYISLIGELYYKSELNITPTIYYRRHGNNQSNTCGKSTNSLGKKIAMRIHMLKAILIVVLRRYLRILPK